MKKIIAALLSCALVLPSVPAFAADAQPINVARNTAVVLTTKTSNTYSNITRINDGITSDDGASFNGAGERVLYINLGAVYNVTEIRGYFGFPTKDGQIPEQFTFGWSKDGTTYETIETVNPNTNKEYDKVLEKSVQAQYISFTVPNASVSRTVRVREIEIYGTYAGISNLNLALDKPVEVTNGKNAASGLTDGRTDTHSAATATEKGSWNYNSAGAQNAVIDLGEVCTVESFKAYFGYPSGGADKPNTGFKIEYSVDNETYVNAVSVAADTSYDYNYSFKLSEPVQARYIKLIINAASSSRTVRVRELEVYGFINEPYYTKADDNSKYTIYNYSNSLKDVVVIKAKYSDNSLASAQLEKIDLFAPGTSKEITAAADETVFIWDGINSMKPIAERE